MRIFCPAIVWSSLSRRPTDKILWPAPASDPRGRACRPSSATRRPRSARSFGWSVVRP